MNVFALANRYKVIQKVSRKQDCNAYKAKDITLDKFVLIKKFYKDVSENSNKFNPDSNLPEINSITDLTLSPENKSCNITARELLATDHINIPKMIDIFSENNIQYIVMDYIAGTNLKKYFKNRNISLEKVIVILLQACDGLTYLHSKRISHDNLNSENIIVTENDLVKILDFKFPDKLAMEKNFHRNDIYSFGLSIYEIFTGKAPNYTIDDFNLSFEDLKVINPLIPDEICRIISKALHKEPSHSFQSINEMSFSLNLAKLKINSDKFDGLSLTGTNNSQKKEVIPPSLLSDLFKNEVNEKYNYFKSFELRKIITDLVSQESTGMLKVISGDNQSTIYIRDGEFYHAGYNKKDIFSIDIFYETLCWENGYYFFEEDVLTEKYSFDSIPSDLLLMDSVKCLDDYKFCSKKYNKSLIPLLITNVILEKVSPKLVEVLNLVDNQRSIKEIIDLSKMDISSTLSGIDELVLKDIISFKSN